MKVTIAASQMACSWNLEKNIEKAINIVHQSADQGAQIILLQELFETPYFCIDTQSKHFDLAKTLSDQTTIKMMQSIAKERNVVLKGDLPIGVSPNGVEAWAYPDLFNLDKQTGAPPDYFATMGQNWGFPTYNWDNMAKVCSYCL